MRSVISSADGMPVGTGGGREEELMKQKTVEAVSAGAMSMEDAEQLTNPKKNPWWKGSLAI